MNKHRYATADGEMDPASVRAAAVGNAVYVEHVGGCGDIFAWGARDPEAAAAIAGELNLILDGLRARHAAAVESVRLTLDQLDGLAAVWGDEGVFRRCRDRLRELVEGEPC